MNDTTYNNELKLLQHCTATAFDTAWMAGYEAAQHDKDETENPFAHTDTEFDAWQQGWWSGFYEEAPLYAHDIQLTTPQDDKTLTLHCERVTITGQSSGQLKPASDNQQTAIIYPFQQPASTQPHTPVDRPAAGVISLKHMAYVCGVLASGTLSYTLIAGD